MKQGRGRPATYRYGSAADPDISLAATIARFEAEFDAMPPKLQAQTIERVRSILAEERPRARPSELAIIAREVYGIDS